jgi:alpha/beta hydrolase family protein
MIPFGPDHLKALYKNHGQYVSKIVQGVNDLVTNGWITREDAAQMKTAAAQSPVPDASPALIKPGSTLYPWPDTYPDWVNAGKP